nr:tRNA pseudouridine(38-40) synthase TruA [Paenibacillus bovis]
MQRYKAIVSYDGSTFSGYQIQPKARTVQGELERALGMMHKSEEVKVTASGRTDAGVHARGQVIHFDSPLQLPPERWLRALNGLLPADIAVVEIDSVPSDFHARFDVTGKIYKYFLYKSKVREPFKRNYATHFPYDLDVELVRAATSYLLGTHDFTSFCSAKTDTDNRIRTIYKIEVVENENEVVFSFTGNGFLYNMVRILVGTLLDVGIGKITPQQVESIVNGRDRALAGKTAPAQGLYLWEVFYD